MPFLILGALLIAGVVIWRMGRMSGSGGNQSGGLLGHSNKACMWVATGNDTPSLGEYYCKTCKVTAYAKGGKPPKECKKNLRGSL